MKNKIKYPITYGKLLNLLNYVISYNISLMILEKELLLEKQNE